MAKSAIKQQVDQDVEQAMRSCKFTLGGRKAIVFIHGKIVEFEHPGAYPELERRVRDKFMSTRTTTATA